jgi:signal transduction histidine kinase
MGWASVMCIAMGTVHILSGNPLHYALFMVMGGVACALMRQLLFTPMRYGTWCLVVTAVTVGGAVPMAIAQHEDGRALMWILVPMLLAATMTTRRMSYIALVISAVGLAAYFGPRHLGWLERRQTVMVPEWQESINAFGLFVLVYFTGRQSAIAFQNSRKQMKKANRELRREAVLHEETRQRLLAANKEVIRTARTAGMAEVATGVLHNVGNALNTVVVMSSSVRDHLADSTMERRLDRLAGLIQTNGTDPELLSRYIKAMSRQVHSEQVQATEDMQRLRDAVDHVSTVVAAQQAHARCRGVVSSVQTSDLMDDISQLAATSLDRYGAVLCIDDTVDAMLTTERHQVVQILENIVRNAAEALSDHAGPRQIHVHTSLKDEIIRIQVVDSGPGIPQEICDTVFQHGFTTKQTGSGFGLHVSALSAQSIGGRLTLDPPLDGYGASFSLWLPLTQTIPPRTEPFAEVRRFSA